MKLTNTFLSVLRHALTTVGGALVVSPEPQTKTIGSILVAIGALWGASDEHKAENTSGPSTPAGGAVAMLILCALLGAFGSMAVTGCTTTATSGVSDKQAAITSGVLNLAGTSIAPVLKSNPDYIPVAQAVYTGLGAINSSSIDAKTITSWISAIASEKKWNAAQVAYAQTLATSAWSIYTSYTGETVAVITDPKIKSWIEAFRSGLANAIAIAGTA